MASSVIANGSASISINAHETEVRLVFIPDPAGEGWDLAAVNRLSTEKHIGACPDPKALETFLHNASKAKAGKPMEMIFLQGIEPEEAVNEKVSWEDLPIPGDLASFREEVLSRAAPPIICRIKVEKIKHEKKIKKPAALPFLPAKEEIEVTWEKNETHEEVAVNPEPLAVKYAARGTKLGAIIPFTPGKPGKSIFGQLIHPKMTGDGTFLFGKGIDRRMNELTAQFSGFIRVGENWADMVPFSTPSWSIDFGSDNITLFLTFEPGDPRFAPPTGEEVLTAAVAKGAEEGRLLSAAKLDKAIAHATISGESLENFVLYLSHEAEARVDISPDKTRAVLYLCKGLGEANPLEMKAIGEAIKGSGVQGYDAEQLKATVKAFMQGTDIVLEDYVLAEGIPSTRGEDRKIHIEAYLLSAEQQKPVRAQLREWNSRHALENDELNPETATGFAFVEKDADVASVSAISEGEAGKDIFGNVIPGLPGNDPDIKLLRGLELHGSAIKAAQSGLLIIEASENSFRGCVIDYRDAKIDLFFSEYDMEAKADLYREEGAGLPLLLENALKILASLGVKKGIDLKETEKACLEARTTGSAIDRILARGEPPVSEGDSAVKWLVPISHSTDLQVVQVKAGDPIAELSKPCAEGRTGHNVKGVEIPIAIARQLTIEHDKSIRELTAEKGKRLIAARSGELSFDGKTLKINSTKIIQGDAGPDTGNINFSGEVQIHGNIHPGCVIIGGSHVLVGGIAEGALISAGGKAVVKLGFKGNGKGIIRARAGIETAFTERASVMCVGDIRLKKGSLFSMIKTNGKLYITEETGKLSGGVCKARFGIDAADIGSDKGLHTSLSFGQDYLIKDQIDICEEEISKLKQILSETELKIKAAIKRKMLIIDEVRKKKVRLVKLLEQHKLKLFTLEEKFEEHYESEIRIRGTIYPGVVLDSHGRYYEVHQKRSRVTFYFDCKSGQIKEKPLD